MKRILLALGAFLVLAAVAAMLVSTLRPDIAYRAAMGFERGLAGFEERSVIVDGLEWRYLEAAEEGAPTVVLIHGFSADKDNWLRISRHIDDDFRLIAPDLIGFGDSARPLDLDYRIRAQADRLVAFLDAMDVERAILAGSSMGGHIAGAIAQSHPERVESLWLIAPGGVVSAEQSEMFTRVLGGGSNPLIPQSAEDFAETLDFIFTEQPFLTASVISYLAARQRDRRDILERIFSDLRYESRPLEEYLTGHPGPTLIVWGTKDRVLHPSGAAILDGLLPLAEVRMMDGAGHLPMIERPRETAEIVLAFEAGR